MERTTLFELFRSFFKIGLFTFGGGYAMVPLIEAEIIERRRWLPQGEFLDLLTLAQSSPGPIAVNTSVFIGYKVRGLRGAVAASLGAVLPSFLIILIVAIFFAGIRHNRGADRRAGLLAGPGHAPGAHGRRGPRGAGRLGPGLVARAAHRRRSCGRHRMDAHNR